MCRARGWDVRLAEKELHGLQDRELGALEDAREALVVSGTTAIPNGRAQH